MAALPEPVQDSRLEATFHPNASVPIETTHETRERRGSPRSETWIRRKQLGNGGYGTVWLERRSETKGRTSFQFRAVKQLKVQKGEGDSGNYIRELEALAKFSKRKFAPFFVKFYGWFEAPDTLFIAMKYYEYGDLKNHITKNGRLPEEQAQEITWQVLQGLLFMHDNNFAHRDLKPANILIKTKPPEYDWQVKICDLGLSKRIGGDIESTTVRGTFGFMPPELLGIGGNPRTANPFPVDLWCLGETTFQILTSHGTFDNQAKLLEYANGASRFPCAPLERFGISETAMEFLKLLMIAVPAERLTAKQANEHQWMAGDSDTSEEPLDAGNIRPRSMNIQSTTLPLHQRESDEASGVWTETGTLQAPKSTRHFISQQPEDRWKRPEAVPVELYGGSYSDDVLATPGSRWVRNAEPGFRRRRSEIGYNVDLPVGSATGVSYHRPSLVTEPVQPSYSSPPNSREYYPTRRRPSRPYGRDNETSPRLHDRYITTNGSQLARERERIIETIQKARGKMKDEMEEEEKRERERKGLERKRKYQANLERTLLYLSTRGHVDLLNRNLKN